MRGDRAPLVPCENIGAKYGILPDMYLGDFYSLAKVIAACIALMQGSGCRVYRNLTLAHYDCRICAVPSAADEGFCKEDYKVWSAPRKEGAMRPGLYLRYIWERGELGCWPVTRIGPSYTEQLLDAFNQGLPGASS
jgi:hypothetical protein